MHTANFSRRFLEVESAGLHIFTLIVRNRATASMIPEATWNSRSALVLFVRLLNLAANFFAYQLQKLSALYPTAVRIGYSRNLDNIIFNQSNPFFSSKKTNEKGIRPETLMCPEERSRSFRGCRKQLRLKLRSSLKWYHNCTCYASQYSYYVDKSLECNPSSSRKISLWSSSKGSNFRFAICQVESAWHCNRCSFPKCSRTPENRTSWQWRWSRRIFIGSIR